MKPLLPGTIGSFGVARGLPRLSLFETTRLAYGCYPLFGIELRLGACLTNQYDVHENHWCFMDTSPVGELYTLFFEQYRCHFFWWFKIVLWLNRLWLIFSITYISITIEILHGERRVGISSLSPPWFMYHTNQSYVLYKLFSSLGVIWQKTEVVFCKVMNQGEDSTF